MTQRVRALNRYAGRIKQVAGGILILTAVGLQYGWLMQLQTFLVQNTTYGTLGTEIEERLFGEAKEQDLEDVEGLTNINSSALPKIAVAPEFSGLGPWHNSSPLRLFLSISGHTPASIAFAHFRIFRATGIPSKTPTNSC
jgi:hypothetical protein